MRKDVIQPKAARNISIEALCLVAVAGIAIVYLGLCRHGLHGTVVWTG